MKHESYFQIPKNILSETDFNIKVPHWNYFSQKNIFFSKKSLNLINLNYEFQNDSHNYLCPFRPDGLGCTTWWQGKYARTFDPIQWAITKTNDFVTKKTSSDPTKKIWTIRLKNLFQLFKQNIDLLNLNTLSKKFKYKLFVTYFCYSFVYFAVQGYVAED